MIRTLLFVILGAAVCLAERCTAEAGPSSAALLAPIRPFASTAEAARVNRIPLDGIDAPTEARGLHAGDSITAILTLHVKSAVTQWILFVRAGQKTPAELSAKPLIPTVVYTSFGNKLEFAPSQTHVTMKTLGPFNNSGRKQKSPAASEDSFDLNEGFLSLGLDEAAAGFYRMHQLKEANKITEKLSFSTASHPFDAASVARAVKWQTLLHITAGEERAWAGADPALMSYFDVIGEAPALESIMWKTIDLPPLWSMVWHAGVSAAIEFPSGPVTPATAAICAAPAYLMPLQCKLNGRRALEVTLLVTTPHSPFLPSGGIIAFLAQNPSKKDVYLTMHLVSARRVV
jgi:hypothetical protein